MVDRSTTTLDSTTGAQTPTGEPPHPLAETGKEAGQRASHLVERGAEIGFKQADRGLAQAATGVESMADSIRRISVDMQAEEPRIAEYAVTAADKAEAFAGYLRETDARQIIGTVESFARRQPLLFLGGAFLLGMAASRFLKAAGGTGRGAAYQPGIHAVGDGTHASRGTGSSGHWSATGPGTRGESADA